MTDVDEVPSSLLFAELRKVAASRARMTVPQSRSGRRSMSVDTMLKKDRAGSLWKDHLPGGLADRKTPADFPSDKLREGVSVEREHASDPAIQAEIAMDHITEDPNYYPKLKRMEAGEKQAGLMDVLKTPIPGTKDWFVNTGKAGLQGAKAITGKAPIVPAMRAANSVVPRASGAMRTAGHAALRGGNSISEAEMQRLGFGDLLKSGAARPEATLKDFQEKLKPGDILLTRAVHQSLMSKIISGVQHSDFGHSALYIGNGRVIDTRNRGEGVIQTSLSEVYKKWGGGGRDIRAYAPSATAEQRDQAIARAKELLGTPYNTLGAVRLLLPAAKNKGIEPGKPKKVICSELIARAYPDLPFAAGKNRAHVLPVDIAKSPLTARVAEVNHGPAKVAFKLQGQTSVQGIPIAIENRKVSVRKGTDPDGTPWRTVYKIPYGYIKGTEGNDGEEIDAYVGPHKDATEVYVIHQHKIDGKGYDEDKVMFGFLSEADARKAYLDHYNKVGPKLLGPISTIKMDDLKKRLEQRRRHTKLSYVTGGSGSGITGNRMAMLDMDEKPERTKPGDVPSMDGTNPGTAGIVRREAGPEMATVLPTNGALANSQTGATTRL
jgi:cell wall-associated NlpC family hydrolase